MKPPLIGACNINCPPSPAAMPFGDTPNTNVFSPVPNDEVPTAKAFIIVTLWLSVLTKEAVNALDADSALFALVNIDPVTKEAVPNSEPVIP